MFELCELHLQVAHPENWQVGRFSVELNLGDITETPLASMTSLQRELEESVNNRLNDKLAIRWPIWADVGSSGSHVVIQWQQRKHEAHYSLRNRYYYHTIVFIILSGDNRTSSKLQHD